MNSQASKPNVLGIVSYLHLIERHWNALFAITLKVDSIRAWDSIPQSWTMVEMVEPEAWCTYKYRFQSMFVDFVQIRVCCEHNLLLNLCIKHYIWMSSAYRKRHWPFKQNARDQIQLGQFVKQKQINQMSDWNECEALKLCFIWTLFRYQLLIRRESVWYARTQ